MPTTAPSMTRIALVFGSLAGFAVILPMLLTMSLAGSDDMAMSESIGYLIMLIALSLILVGIKRYRDEALGGVIGFWRALLVGLLISAVAALIYVGVWEFYLFQSNYAFIDQYLQQVIETRREAGLSEEALAAEVSQLREMMDRYREQPLFRIMITFAELLPVGLIVSLVSAALLRFPGFLPRRRAATA